MVVDALRAVVEAERQRFGAPGVAVAVVQDGEVLLAEGFGVGDVDSGAPVTATTPFPLASDTKAFTAATLCVLAEQGRIDLDAPIREHLPWFALRDPLASSQVSARDLLCHRTGLPRHDLVWAGETARSLEELGRAMQHLEPSQGFRQGWQYSNLAYNAAGHLVEQVAGRPYTEAVRQLLLQPLGMTAAGWDARAVEASIALPYRSIEGRLVRQALPPSDSPGPSGGLVAHVEDVARWLLARLGGGDVLSGEVLAELHAPVIALPAGPGAVPGVLPMGYALGCRVEAYRGHRWVRHGGSLIGYSSDVGVAPEAGIGIAVLSNLDMTSMPVALSHRLLDLLLDLEPGDSTSLLERDVAALAAYMTATREHGEAARRRPPSLAPDELAGTYRHPAYGDLEVVAVQDGITVRFHGISDVAVAHRDRDVWDLTLVSMVTFPMVFRTESDGEVSGVSIPFEPAVRPIEFERAR